MSNNEYYNCGITQLVIPQSFENCYTYEKQLLWLYRKYTELEKRVKELEKKEV